MMKSVVLLGDTTPVSLALIDCSPGGFWSLRQGRLVVALCVRCLRSIVCEGLRCVVGFASTGNWYILYVADRKGHSKSELTLRNEFDLSSVQNRRATESLCIFPTEE
jgi:hypothetical protein